tara:strand:+ start:2131 stop:2328 length:198 start_codon:yes stop_codon:yes gene_type:complete
LVYLLEAPTSVDENLKRLDVNLRANINKSSTTIIVASHYSIYGRIQFIEVPLELISRHIVSSKLK